MSHPKSQSLWSEFCLPFFLPLTSSYTFFTLLLSYVFSPFICISISKFQPVSKITNLIQILFQVPAFKFQDEVCLQNVARENSNCYSTAVWMIARLKGCVILVIDLTVIKEIGCKFLKIYFGCLRMLHIVKICVFFVHYTYKIHGVRWEKYWFWTFLLAKK